MDDSDRIRVEHDCALLVNRYGLAVNRWDLDAFVDLFTEDAVWQRPKVPALVGHAEIRGFMAAQPTMDDRIMRDVQGGIVVDAVDEDLAKVYSQTTVYDAAWSELPAQSTAPDMVVEYEDAMVRRAGRWFIQRRDTVVVFKR